MHKSAIKAIIMMMIIIIIIIIIIPLGNNNNNFKKSYLQLIHLKKRKDYSFKTLFTSPVNLKST